MPLLCRKQTIPKHQFQYGKIVTSVSKEHHHEQYLMKQLLSTKNLMRNYMQCQWQWLQDLQAHRDASSCGSPSNPWERQVHFCMDPLWNTPGTVPSPQFLTTTAPAVTSSNLVNNNSSTSSVWSVPTSHHSGYSDLLQVPHATKANINLLQQSFYLKPGIRVSKQKSSLLRQKEADWSHLIYTSTSIVLKEEKATPQAATIC